MNYLTLGGGTQNNEPKETRPSGNTPTSQTKTILLCKSLIIFSYEFSLFLGFQPLQRSYQHKNHARRDDEQKKSIPGIILTLPFIASASTSRKVATTKPPQSC